MFTSSKPVEKPCMVACSWEPSSVTDTAGSQDPLAAILAKSVRSRSSDIMLTEKQEIGTMIEEDF